MNFTDAGFTDLEVGTTLFKNLDLNEEHFSSPIQITKIREIASFLNDHPDPLYVISLIKYNKSPNMDNLDYLSSYARLNREAQEVSAKLQNINKELSFYGK